MRKVKPDVLTDANKELPFQNSEKGKLEIHGRKRDKNLPINDIRRMLAEIPTNAHDDNLRKRTEALLNQITSEKKDKWVKTIKLELAISAILGLLVLSGSYVFNLPQKFFLAIGNLENSLFDDFLFLMAFLFIIGIIFSFRRFREGYKGWIIQNTIMTLTKELEVQVEERTYDLSKSNETLLIEINHRKNVEKELMDNNAELKKINSELDRFVYSISHELRSPLTAVMGVCSLIRQKNMEAENKELLRLIDLSVFKMDETLKEMLDYSRNARLAVKTEKVELRKIIEDAFENSIYFNETFVYIKSVKINEELPFYSDPRRIKMIINNLISNALKYGKKDYPESFIEINIEIDKEKMILKIEDNGIGIATEQLKNLFNMFYRATVTASGSGLGLYIAKECAEKLGGTVAVESEFGNGTTFTIEIPNNSIN